MPELVEATVRIDSYQDKCDCDDRMACYHVMRAGDTSDIEFDSDDEEGSEDYAGQNTTKCVVLEGLAQAKDLVLIADHSTVHPDMSFTYMCSIQKISLLIAIIYIHTRAFPPSELVE